ASQYRGVEGGEGMEEFGGAELADVLNLLPLLDSLPQADTSRVGMYGWSRGGMMTYLALTKTDRIKAAVVGAAPTDVAGLIADRPVMEERVLAELVPRWEQNRSAAIEERSAMLWPERLHPKTPILLLHGSADWRVDPTQSLRMATALYEAKRPFRLVVFEGGDHGLSEFREEVNDQVVQWFDRYVRDGETWPSLEPHGR
ncbi:MAG: prolyl oligopeptidase family serine peptidase, partial [Acidobacteriota bacterium]